MKFVYYFLPFSDDLNMKSKTKRVRTTFTEEQVQVLQANFQLDSNPDGQDLERIAQITGLSKRVTQVWFQNSRARQKKQQQQSRSGNSSPSPSSSPSKISSTFYLTLTCILNEYILSVKTGFIFKWVAVTLGLYYGHGVKLFDFDTCFINDKNRFHLPVSKKQIEKNAYFLNLKCMHVSIAYGVYIVFVFHCRSITVVEQFRQHT